MNKQPVKNPKAKMVDAVTQTERSDYMMLKTRALHRKFNERPKEGTVQLRIANIELHETAFSGQNFPRTGGNSQYQ